MADMMQLIKQKLPESLRELAQEYTIPEDYLTNEPELIELTLKSKSIDKKEEKQSWFNLLPLMNDEQVQKLRDILSREKQKLAEIEAKYEDKKQEIKKKYLAKRQNMGYVKKINDIHIEETNSREQEMEEAEALLEGL